MGNPTTWALIGCLLLGCFAQTMNGYDGSVFGGLTANHYFLDFVHGTQDGVWAAINTAMYQVRLSIDLGESIWLIKVPVS
jgi:hypothetical protein